MEAGAELRQGIEELLALVRADGARLTAAAQALDDPRHELLAGTRDAVAEHVALARTRSAELGRRLLALRQDATLGLAPATALRTAHADAADRLRAQVAVTAALSGAADWQSPSFGHAVRPAAGLTTGRVVEHVSDYRRDRHDVAAVWEAAWVAGCVDGPEDVRALLTGCGMAAVTTALLWLHGRGALAAGVVAGRGVYHETRELLALLAPGRVHEVDECDGAAVAQACAVRRPGAVVLDALGNTAATPLPDLPAVLRAVAASAGGRRPAVLVDVTGLSVTCQPFAVAEAAGVGEAVEVVVVESLLKHAQLGLDRANAGVLLARGGVAAELDGLREHLGTNVPDVAARCLPPPDRGLLQRRLGRLGRNAAIVAHALAAAAPPDGAVEVSHPLLPDHRSAAVARGLPFAGSCVAVRFADDTPTQEQARAFVAAALAGARAVALPLHAGSSFGFDVPRVYRTAATTAHGRPFVRLAAGAGPAPDAAALGAVLASALRVAVAA